METFQNVTHSQKRIAAAKWNELENPEWNWLSRKYVRANSETGDVRNKPLIQRVPL